jgi:hypothetical protein
MEIIIRYVKANLEDASEACKPAESHTNAMNARDKLGIN